MIRDFIRELKNPFLSIALGSMLVLAIILWNVSFAHAHYHNHPELDVWFKSLHAKSGAWCCNGEDAEIADWSISGNHYRVRIGEQWVTVPDDAVVEGANKVGGARVWPMYQDGKPGVRCFLPDSLT